MQKLLLFVSLAVLTCAQSAEQPVESKEPPASPQEQAKKPTAAEAGAAQDKAAEEFRAMPLDYRLLVMEAMKRFQSRDFTGALSFTDRAEQLQVPNVWTLNVRGAVAIEKRQFDEGIRYCELALKMDPAFFPAKFNMCEIPFLQAKYPEARKMWEKLLADYPVSNAVGREDGTPELLTYRIFLCHLLEKDATAAKVWLDKIPFPSATPAYHYANAAWEHEQGTKEKWDWWLQQAEYIWPEVKRANFTDVLIQLGWIKPAFGENPPAKK